MSPETFLLSPNTVLTAALLLALMAMALVVLRDVRIFEIDFALLAMAALNTGVVVLATGGPGALGGAMASALVIGLITAALCYWRPGWLGQGDIRLMAFLGLAAGPEHMPVTMTAFLAFAVLTSAAYSFARGKRPFRSMFPAALPAMGAAVIALILRLSESGLWREGQAGGAGGADALLALHGFHIATVLTVIIALVWQPDSRVIERKSGGARTKHRGRTIITREPNDKDSSGATANSRKRLVRPSTGAATNHREGDLK